jgi:hypothetical protein
MEQRFVQLLARTQAGIDDGDIAPRRLAREVIICSASNRIRTGSPMSSV